MTWSVDIIPSESNLFRKFHKNGLGKKYNLPHPPPAVFKNTPEEDPNLSVDWDKYSTPSSILELISKQYKTGTTTFKDKSQFFIIKINVGDVLNTNTNQKVNHNPKQFIPEELGNPNNRAHTLIIGDKTDEEIRLKLACLSNWAIGP